MHFTRHPIAQRIGILATGAAATQVIPLLLSPIITRLYSPSAYGALTLLSACIGIVSSVATGRYHQAILIPKDDIEAQRLARLSLVVASCVCGTLMIATTLYLATGLPLGVLEPLGNWLLAAPLAALIGSLAETLTILNIRFDKTAAIATSGVARTGTTGVCQLGLASPVGGKEGLIIGALVGPVFGAWILAPALRTQGRVRLNYAATRRLARRYRRFPLYDTWGTLANMASYSLLIMGVATLYATATVGHYAISYRTLALPMAILGTAISQAISRTLATRLDTAVFHLTYNKTLAFLIAISIPTFSAAWFAAPNAFEFVFGPEWRPAGELASAMIPLVAIRFVASPLTAIFSITESQRLFMLLQIALLVATVGLLALAHRGGWPVIDFLYTHSITLGMLYVLAIGLGFLRARARSR